MAMTFTSRRRIGPLTIGIIVVGALMSLSAALIFQARAKVEAEAWLSERAEIVGSAIQATVQDLAAGLEAAAAFIEVTPDVSQDQLTEFIHKLDPRLSLIGVALVPRIPAEELASFEQSMQATYPGYEVKELSVTGDAASELGIRPAYWPVQYFVPGEFLRAAVPEADGAPLDLSLGVDAGTRPEWEASLAEALNSQATLASDFIRVEFEEVVLGKAFVIAVPIKETRPGSNPMVLAAPMIDVILPTALDVSIADDVTWEIESTEVVLPPPEQDIWWDGTIALPGTEWQLRVQPSASGSAAHGVTPWWLILSAGLGLTAVGGAVSQLMRHRTFSKARLIELQRISEDKDRFLASVSHEIRTPLTAVSGLAHELRDRPGDFGEEEIHALLDLIAEQSDEVGAIVEDLLVAARSDIGKVSVHLGNVDPRQEAVRALETSGFSARIVGDSPPAAFADAQRVRQILRNLITNAGKYGGAAVEIRFESDPRFVTITVADDGNEIPLADQQRIFAPYTSAHSDRGNVGSIGLGLFISRKLATLMTGTLEYSHDGSWGLFSLRLPLSPASMKPGGRRAEPADAVRPV